MNLVTGAHNRRPKVAGVFDINPITLEFIQQAGRHPGYRYGIARIERNRRDHGYAFFPVARAFVTSYGGLHV